MAIAMTKTEPMLALPNIRNGKIEDIVPAAPKEYIPKNMRWTTIKDLPGEAMAPYVNYLVKAQFVTLCAGDYSSMDAQAREKLRKTAITLGGVRTGAAVSYRLVESDFTASEVTGCPYTAKATATGYELVEVGGTAAAGKDAWNGCSDLTDAEYVYVAGMMHVGIAVPALQGWSLTKYGHHFLSAKEQPPRKAYDALLKQLRTTVRTEVSDRFKEDDWEDLAFHKACHPIDPKTKQLLAKDLDVKQRLITAGLGSAAVRLPATLPELELAKTSIQIIRQIAPILVAMGGTVDVSNLAKLIDNATAATPGQDEVTKVGLAVHAIEANGALVAYCAGMLARLTEDTSRSTLLAAFSVKRLMGEYPHQVSAGGLDMGAYNASQRVKREQGQWNAPTLTI